MNNMNNKPKWLKELESMSDEQIEKIGKKIREDFKGVFDELAKH